MPLTKQEHVELLDRYKAGQIRFMFDPAQCKNFLLKIDCEEAAATFGNSLRFESFIIKLLALGVQPGALILSIFGSVLWLKWWGLLAGLGVFVFWGILVSSSAIGSQRLITPVLGLCAGMFIAYFYRDQGNGFLVFMLAISFLFASTKLLYVLPVWFFSAPTILTNYDLVSYLYEEPIDEFNKRIGIPLMWHVETPDGRLP